MHMQKILKNAFIDSLRKQKNKISLDERSYQYGNQVAQLGIEI